MKKDIESLSLQLGIIGKQVAELRTDIKNIKEDDRKYIEKYIDKKEIRLSKLRDDCIGMLKLLKLKGVVTNEELAEVM